MKDKVVVVTGAFGVLGRVVALDHAATSPGDLVSILGEGGFSKGVWTRPFGFGADA